MDQDDDLDSGNIIRTRQTALQALQNPSASNTESQPSQLELNHPITRPCAAAPTEPVPSIMPATVAIIALEPLSEACWPKSALTAVVINAYGPFTRPPRNSISTTWTQILEAPRPSVISRYTYNDGIVKAK